MIPFRYLMVRVIHLFILKLTYSVAKPELEIFGKMNHTIHSGSKLENDYGKLIIT